MLDRSLKLLSKRPKCLFCIPVETACFIYGVFTSVCSGFSLLALCVTLNGVTTKIHDKVEEMETAINPDIPERRAFQLLMCYLAVLFLYLCAVVSFIFNVFLCYGVHKRRAGFIKAYLVYGVLLTVLVMAGAVLYTWMQADLVGGSFILIACGIFSLLLLMVQRTYEMIRTEATIEQAQLLETKPCMKA